MRGAKRYFLNQAFSKNPTVNFPSHGAGFATNWKPSLRTGNLALEFPISRGLKAMHQVDFSLDSNALFGTLQAAYSFTGMDGKGCTSADHGLGGR